MKIIMNVKLKEGYEKWKNLFLSVDTHREKYGIKVLAYGHPKDCLLYTSPSPRDATLSRMPSSA